MLTLMYKNCIWVSVLIRSLQRIWISVLVGLLAEQINLGKFNVCELLSLNKIVVFDHVQGRHV